MSKTDCFFDTNILVYALSTERAKAERSIKLMDIGGTISVQGLNEFTLVARRKYRLDWPLVRARLQDLRDILTVVPVTVDTHQRGIEISERYGFGVYDSMIVAAAQLSGCTTLYSEDMQDGQVIDGLTICNPYK
jgi:predicted nucleic acid-binding protein